MGSEIGLSWRLGVMEGGCRGCASVLGWWADQWVSTLHGHVGNSVVAGASCVMGLGCRENQGVGTPLWKAVAMASWLGDCGCHVLRLMEWNRLAILLWVTECGCPCAVGGRKWLPRHRG